MKSDLKIAVLGGDLRQYAAASTLCEHGWKIALWGLEKAGERDERIEHSDSFEEAVNLADVWLLPLPSSVAGNTLNCPLYSQAKRLKLKDMLSDLSEKTIVIGGRIPFEIAEDLRKRNIRVFDYFESEDFQICNAYTTAEAAVSIAMNSLNREIKDSRIAVTGYGRIAKHLCYLFKALGANITILARKEADLAFAECIGAKTLSIASEADKKISLRSLESGYDIIYNTVPSWLFDRSFLERVDRKTFIIELASAPGGIDVCAAKELGSNVLWAASLPGKYAPESAGRLIGDCVNRIIEKEVCV
jgi:dipicolinate synthase subunit A